MIDFGYKSTCYTAARSIFIHGVILYPFNKLYLHVCMCVHVCACVPFFKMPILNNYKILLSNIFFDFDK